MNPKKSSIPTRYPASFIIPGANGTAVLIADRMAWKAALVNREVLDDEKVAGLPEGTVCTVDTVRQILLSDVTFVEPRLDDGPEVGSAVTCFMTGEKFVPEVFPNGGGAFVLRTKLWVDKALENGRKGGAPEKTLTTMLQEVQELTGKAYEAAKAAGITVPETVKELRSCVIACSPEGRKILLEQAQAKAKAEGGQAKFIRFQSWSSAVEGLVRYDGKLADIQQKAEVNSGRRGIIATMFASRPIPTSRGDASRGDKPRDAEWRGVLHLFQETADMLTVLESVGGPKSAEQLSRMSVENFVKLAHGAGYEKFTDSAAEAVIRVAGHASRRLSASGSGRLTATPIANAIQSLSASTAQPATSQRKRRASAQ